MHTARTISLAALLPADLVDGGVGHLELNIPEWAFEPDQWSFAFLRGLLKLALDDLHVWEVGCGTGLNLMLLRSRFPRARLRFSDYNPMCVPLATRHLCAMRALDGTEPLHGQWDLVHNVQTQATAAEWVDVVVACIPQVPTDGFDLAVGDNYAHYYDPGRYAEARLHAVGLGLNEALLQRAKFVLRPGGRVVLNLGGRPGLQQLLNMFSSAGYAPRVVHEEVIAQHAETSLEPLARLETVPGHAPFEFFADDAAHEALNAAQAEARRLAGAPLYHKIYVVEGTLAQ